jgi:cell division protein FtsX
MTLFGIVLRNQAFHCQKVSLTVLLTGLMLFAPIASVLMTRHIRSLAEKPLQSLNTELILQNDRSDAAADKIRTAGIILPFNLNPFLLPETREKLNMVHEINQYSTALVLWQFDLNNTRTIIAINCDDPQVGLRKIESFLMPGGRFFSGNKAQEVILERHYAKLYRQEVNQPFDLAGKRFIIVGIVDFKEQSNLNTASIFLPYKTGLRLSKQQIPVINQVFLSLHSSSDRETVSRKAETLFPGFSLITKDSLLKNLSSFNKFLYRFGSYFMMIVIPLSLLLAAWIIKIYQLDLSYQTDILKIIGWPRKELFRWRLYDTAVIAFSGLCVAFVLSVPLSSIVLPMLTTAPVLDQGFRL